MGNMSYKMGQIIIAIERNRRKIDDATVHVMLNKNGIMKNLLHELKSKHDIFYDQLYDYCAECLRILRGENRGRLP
jgi:hypothetical protein